MQGVRERDVDARESDGRYARNSSGPMRCERVSGLVSRKLAGVFWRLCAARGSVWGTQLPEDDRHARYAQAERFTRQASLTLGHRDGAADSPIATPASSLRGAEGDAAIHLRVAAVRWIASSLRSSQ